MSLGTDRCVLLSLDGKVSSLGRISGYFILKCQSRRLIGRSRQRDHSRSIMIVEVDRTVVCAPILDPLRNDLLEFNHARMLIVPYKFPHLLKERDPLFESVFLRFVNLRHLFLERCFCDFFRRPPNPLKGGRGG